MIKFHADITMNCTSCKKENREFPDLESASNAYYDVEEAIEIFVKNEPCRWCQQRTLILKTYGDLEQLDKDE